MHIKILCFGKLDQTFYEETFTFYKSKITKRDNFEVIELKEDFKNEPIINLQANSKQLELNIQKWPDYEVVLLDVHAKQISSEDLADILEENKNFKTGNILFVIGPSEGYDEEFKFKYKRISFGKITFPHQLFRVVLVEQIYRGLKINYHEKYHK